MKYTKKGQVMEGSSEGNVPYTHVLHMRNLSISSCNNILIASDQFLGFWVVFCLHFFVYFYRNPPKNQQTELFGQ